MRADGPLLAGAGGALLVSSSISLAVPMFMGSVIDASLAESVASDPGQWALGLMGLLGGQSLLVAGRSAVLSVAGERVILRLRRRLLSSILARDLGAVEAAHAGEVLSRLQSDAESARSAVTSVATSGVRGVVMGAGGTAMLCYLSPLLASATLLLIPPVALGGRYFGRSVRDRQRAVQDRIAAANAAAESAVANLRTVRALGGEAMEASRYAERLEAAFRSAIGVAGRTAAFEGCLMLAANASLVSVLGLGASQVLSGAMTPGELTSFLLYSVNVGVSITSLSQVYADAMKASGATQRVFDLIDAPPAPTATTAAPLPLPPPAPSRPASALERLWRPPPRERSGLPERSGGAAAAAAAATAAAEGGGEELVVFEGVRFAYPGRRGSKVLRGLDLRVSRGEHVAIVGGSGSGKTTLAALLLRLYDPDGGEVRVGGLALREWDTADLRRAVALVPQELALLSGTVRDNIAYGAGGADDAAVRDAAERAGALAFAERLPEGLDTAVGDRGLQLSGGERQRVSVARAILRRPRVVVLDEATSALDLASAARVHDALRELQRAGTAVLSIAHRPSTIREADRVVVLEGGRVAEEGAFDALMRKGPEGALRRMLSSRSGAAAGGEGVKGEGGSRGDA